MFSQFKLKMGKGHSSSSGGSKPGSKKEKNQPTGSGDQQQRPPQPLPILKHSEPSRSAASAAPSPRYEQQPPGHPHPNVHYADQQYAHQTHQMPDLQQQYHQQHQQQQQLQHQQQLQQQQQQQHPQQQQPPQSTYSNGMSGRLSGSSTSSNLTRNGTLPRPLPNSMLSASLSSNAISNNISLNGSVSLSASQNSTLSRPQMPPPMQSLQGAQPIYVSRGQPIYGSSGGPPQMGRQMMPVQPLYGQTQPINPIYGQAGLYTQYKQFAPPQQHPQQMPLGLMQMDPRWTRAASALQPDDEDPGIMSEVETSSTGFRRSSKIRASLPIVRTMSKTLDRSMGLVFLQYRQETKKALLPNEITSLDTVKALYVRSFPRQLSMNYFDDRNLVRIYIHDQSKDVFYELEDLREVKDRCILRIYEQDLRKGVWQPVGGGAQLPGSKVIYGATGAMYAEELSYFSEPEFDVESRVSSMQRKRFSTTIAPPTSGYYGTVVHRPHLMYKPNGAQPMNGKSLNGDGQMMPMLNGQPMKYAMQPGHSSTLPRGVGLMCMSAYEPKPQPTPPPKPQRSFASSLSASQLNQPMPGSPSSLMLGASARMNAGAVGVAAGQATLDRALPERPYSVAGNHPYDGRPLDSGRPLFDPRQFDPHTAGGQSNDPRTQHARAAAAAATAAAAAAAAASGRRGPDGQPAAMDNETHRLLHQINKYVESLATAADASDGGRRASGSIAGVPANVNLGQLKGANARLATDVKQLREHVISFRQELNSILEELRGKLRDQLSMLSLPDGGEQRLRWTRMRLSREETGYRTEVRRLEQQLSELEASVERLRANVINRRCKVNMPDVETMALSLSRASKHLSELKASFPALQSQLKITMTKEMQVVVDEEKFLKEEPDRLENALRRCKKLTGTLVTLKRLASVQEQRSTASKGSLEKSLSTDSNGELDNAKGMNMLIQVTPATPTLVNNAKPENVLDSLLDELQIFTTNAKHGSKSPQGDSSEKPSGSTSSSAQQGRRSFDLGKKSAPQPPPRSSSSKINEQQEQIRQLLLLQSTASSQKSPQARSDQGPPTAPKPNVIRSNSEPSGKQPLQRSKSSGSGAGSDAEQGSGCETQAETASTTNGGDCNGNALQMQLQLMPSMSNTSLSSIDSQESVLDGAGGPHRNRQQRLEERHQELLRKQRLLQEQYTQLQQLYRGELPKNLLFSDLKKTASDSSLSAGDPKPPKAEALPKAGPVDGSLSVSNGQNGATSDAESTKSTSSNRGEPFETSGKQAQKVFRTDLL